MKKIVLLCMQAVIASHVMGMGGAADTHSLEAIRAQLSKQDDRGQNSLHRAVLADNIHKVAQLIACGVSSVPDHTGRTPLAYQMQKQYAENFSIARMLAGDLKEVHKNLQGEEKEIFYAMAKDEIERPVNKAALWQKMQAALSTQTQANVSDIAQEESKEKDD